MSPCATVKCMRHIFVGIVLIFALTFPVLAQTPEAMSPSTPSAVSYQTPNVGLLPNHPLYKLQLFWDRLSILTTSYPYARAKKYISLADRELTAADKIIGGGSDAIALHTAFRGEHYMTLFVNTLKSAAYNTGSLDMTVTKRAHDAFPYHQQMISLMIEKSSGDVQSQLRQILEFSQRNDNELTLLEEEYTVTNKEQ